MHITHGARQDDLHRSTECPAGRSRWTTHTPHCLLWWDYCRTGAGSTSHVAAPIYSSRSPSRQLLVRNECQTGILNARYSIFSSCLWIFIYIFYYVCSFLPKLGFLRKIWLHFPEMFLRTFLSGLINHMGLLTTKLLHTLTNKRTSQKKNITLGLSHPSLYKRFNN